MEPREYLEQLQDEAAENHTQELYLWPRTPISNLQAEAWQRVGHSDWSAHPDSRPNRVTQTLRQLRRNRLIPERFTLVDICCGDGLIPWRVKRAFPFADCCGVDLNKDRLETHAMVQDQGVKLYRIPIQRMFRDKRDTCFDVAVMFNTYRGWESADLAESEQWIIDAADDWFRYHARYTILTVSSEQIERLKQDGWWVTPIGVGEDQSRMVLMWPCATGDLEGLWQSQRARS